MMSMRCLWYGCLFFLHAYVLLWSPRAFAAESVQLVKIAVTIRESQGHEQIPGELRASASGVDPIVKYGAIPGDFTFSLPGGKVWTISTVAPGFWAPQEIVVTHGLGAPVNELQVSLWVTSQLTGRIFGTGREALPSELTAQFRSAPGVAQEPSIPQGEVSCPVDAEARWICELPVGTLDVGLRAPGFITSYHWGLQVSVNRELNVGAIELKKGAWLHGWVQVAGNAEAAGVELALQPQMAGVETRDSSLARNKNLKLTTTANSRGFFQFEGLAPGRYDVEARLEGYALVNRRGIEVFENSETELVDAIVLERPKDLEVFVEPASDWDGNPWLLTLSSLGAVPRVLEQVGIRRTQEGWARWGGLNPGKYRLSIGKGSDEIVHSQEIEITAPIEQVFIELEAIPLEGNLRLGSEPVAAELWFGGRRGRVRIHMKSDSDGTFSGLLSREGFWDVGIVGKEPSISRNIRVEVQRRPGKKRAIVDIVLPATFLEGYVVDEAGSPVFPALVSAFPADRTRAEKPTTQYVDEDGKFRFAGFSEGVVLLQAEAPGERESNIHRAMVLTNGLPTPVRLIVRERMRSQGILLGPNGPVVGAAVTLTPSHTPLAPAATVSSDAEGSFPISVPRGTKAVRFQISAPGYAFAMRNVELSRNTPLVIALEPAGGTIIIDLPSSAETADHESDWSAQHMALCGASGCVGQLALVRWAAINGLSQEGIRRFVIPEMEPGDYSACMLYIHEWIAATFGTYPSNRCIHGTLFPFGQLELRLSEVKP